MNGMLIAVKRTPKHTRAPKPGCESFVHSVTAPSGIYNGSVSRVGCLYGHLSRFVFDFKKTRRSSLCCPVQWQQGVAAARAKVPMKAEATKVQN
jgi:hypothetical protein